MKYVLSALCALLFSSLVWGAYVSSPAIYVGKADGLYVLYLHPDSVQTLRKLSLASVNRVATSPSGRKTFFSNGSLVSLDSVSWGGKVGTVALLGTASGFSWPAVLDMQFNASSAKVLLFEGADTLSSIPVYTGAAGYTRFDPYFVLSPAPSDVIQETRFFSESGNAAAILVKASGDVYNKMRIVSSALGYGVYDSYTSMADSLVNLQGMASSHHGSIFAYDNTNKKLFQVQNNTGYPVLSFATDLGVSTAIRKADAHGDLYGGIETNYVYYWLDDAGLHRLSNITNAVSKATLLTDLDIKDFALALERQQWKPNGQWMGYQQAMSGGFISLRHPAVSGVDTSYLTCAVSSTPLYGTVYMNNCNVEYTAPSITAAENGKMDSIVVTMTDTLTGAVLIDTLAIKIRFSNTAPTFKDSLNKTTPYVMGDSLILSINDLVTDSLDVISHYYRIREVYKSVEVESPSCGNSSLTYDVPATLYQNASWIMRSYAVELGAGTGGGVTATWQYSTDGTTYYQTAVHNLYTSGAAGYAEIQMPDSIVFFPGYHYRVLLYHSYGKLCKDNASNTPLVRLFNESHGAILPKAQFAYSSVFKKYRLTGVIQENSNQKIGTATVLELVTTIFDGIERVTHVSALTYARPNLAPHIERLGLRDTLYLPVPRQEFNSSTGYMYWRYRLRSNYYLISPEERIDENGLNGLNVEMKWANTTSTAAFNDCGSYTLGGSFVYTYSGAALQLALCPDSGAMGTYAAQMRLKDTNGTALGGVDTSVWKSLQIFFDANPTMEPLQNVKSIPYGIATSFKGVFKDPDGVSKNKVRLLQVDTLVHTVPQEETNVLTTPGLRIDFKATQYFTLEKLLIKGTYTGDTVLMTITETNNATNVYYSGGKVMRAHPYGEWMMVDVPDSLYLMAGTAYSIHLTSTNESWKLPIGSLATANAAFYSYSVDGTSTANAILYAPVSGGPEILLMGNSQEVAWASGFIGVDTYGVQFKPAQENLGSHLFWLVLGDGFVEAVDSVRVEVVAPSIINIPQFLDTTVQVVGLAVRLGSGLANSAGHAWSLQVRITGGSLDTLLNADRIGGVVLGGIEPGSYIANYQVLDTLTGNLLASKSISFTVTSPVLQVVANQWSMQGVAGENFQDWPVATEVFYWDDTASVASYWQYQERQMLDTARTGVGYWVYSAELLDFSLPLAKPQDSLRWSLILGKTGWHMVANPYSWAIDVSGVRFAKDTVRFWVWNADKADYVEQDYLRPYEGAWVHLNESGTLAAPTAPFFQVESALTKKSLYKIVDNSNWQLGLRLRSGDLLDEENLIGIGEKSAKVLEPPGKMGAYVRLSLGDEDGAVLARSIQTTGKQRYTWTVALSSDEDRGALLEVAGLAALRQAGWSLWMEKEQKYVEIQPEQSVAMVLSKAGTVAQLVALPLGQLPVAQVPLLHFSRQGAHGRVFWEWTGEATQGILDIVDVNGRILWSGHVSMKNGANEQNVKVMHSAGACWLRLRTPVGDAVRGIVLP
jgi:hypothetical protein